MEEEGITVACLNARSEQGIVDIFHICHVLASKKLHHGKFYSFVLCFPLFFPWTREHFYAFAMTHRPFFSKHLPCHYNIPWQTLFFKMAWQTLLLQIMANFFLLQHGKTLLFMGPWQFKFIENDKCSLWIMANSFLFATIAKKYFFYGTMAI